MSLFFFCPFGVGQTRKPVYLPSIKTRFSPKDPQEIKGDSFGTWLKNKHCMGLNKFPIYYSLQCCFQ